MFIQNHFSKLGFQSSRPTVIEKLTYGNIERSNWIWRVALIEVATWFRTWETYCQVAWRSFSPWNCDLCLPVSRSFMDNESVCHNTHFTPRNKTWHNYLQIFITASNLGDHQVNSAEVNLQDRLPNKTNRSVSCRPRTMCNSEDTYLDPIPWTPILNVWSSLLLHRQAK